MQLRVYAFLYLLFKLMPGFSLFCGFIQTDNYDGVLRCYPGTITHRSPKLHQAVKIYFK